MDTKYIDQLLEKFWAAETTDQDEKQLKSYFAQDNIHETHAYAAPFFTDWANDGAENRDFTSKIIHNLITKYFDATASIEEEQLIYEYFAQDKIDGSLAEYKGLFRSYQMIRNVAFNKPLQIDLKKTTGAKVISLTWIKASVAAAVFVVGGFFLFKTMNQPPQATMAKARYIEPENPEEALEMTLQALAMVSRKYKKGEEQLLQGMKTMNNAKGAGN